MVGIEIFNWQIKSAVCLGIALKVTRNLSSALVLVILSTPLALSSEPAESTGEAAAQLWSFLDGLDAQGDDPVISFFAIGGAGYGGTPLPGDLVLRDILQYRDPLPILEAWLQRGNPVERAYALAGLYYVDSERYQQAKKVLMQNRVPFNEMQGCSLEQLTYPQLIERIEAGQHRRHLQRYLAAESPSKPARIIHFCLGGITPLRLAEGENRLQAILATDDPVAGLEAWNDVARFPAERAYILVGLYDLAPERYQQIKQSLKPDQDYFSTYDRLYLRSTNLLRLTEEIEAGEYNEYVSISKRAKCD